MFAKRKPTKSSTTIIGHSNFTSIGNAHDAVLASIAVQFMHHLRETVLGKKMFAPAIRHFFPLAGEQ
jgi:hypothetical protein